MKKAFFVGLLLLMNARPKWAQMGGSASVGDRLTPAQMERSKRQVSAAQAKDDGTATFIEASILMNVKADEYVAVFGVIKEGKTPEEASTNVGAAIDSFKGSLKSLGVADEDLFVDFVSQNRIYAYRVEEKLTKEELVGFELKKNVSVHFKDKLLVDKMVVAAARAQIFDLIKVDYIVKDRDAIQTRLQTQTMGIIRQKWANYQNALGVKLSEPSQVLVDKPSVYYPIEQYSSYTVAESEGIRTDDEAGRTLLNARKSRTTFFNALSGDGFDNVINPLIIEPAVQFTTYIKVKCNDPKIRRK